MFSNRLKTARQLRNLTLEQLADKYNNLHDGGLNKGTLSKYENNRQEPMITVVSNLAEVLDVSLDYLLGKSDNISNQNNVETQIPALSPELAVLCRRIEEMPDDQRQKLIRALENSVDVYLDIIKD